MRGAVATFFAFFIKFIENLLTPPLSQFLGLKSRSY